jgi:hypothetical protein
MVVGHLPSKGKALSSNPGTSKRVFKIISVHMFSLSLEVVLARHWWLTPVILAIQEAEIRRIMVQSQPRKIVHETLSRKNPSQKRVGGELQGVGPEFKVPQRKKKRGQVWWCDLCL